LTQTNSPLELITLTYLSGASFVKEGNIGAKHWVKRSFKEKSQITGIER